jgi:hypothetical protein
LFIISYVVSFFFFSTTEHPHTHVCLHQRSFGV